MRGEQIIRQWRLLLLLSERLGGVSAKHLADELLVSVRTLYRDLEILERVGIALVQEREGREVTWRLLDARRLRMGPSYSHAEVSALREARSALARQRGEGDDLGRIDGLIAKITTMVGPGVRPPPFSLGLQITPEA